MGNYTIQINRDGLIRFRAEVPAVESGLVGDYLDGHPYQPDPVATRAVLPHHYRKSFDRALSWWQSESMSGRSMPLKRDLYTLRGKPMGTLYATPDWPVGTK